MKPTHKSQKTTLSSQPISRCSSEGSPSVKHLADTASFNKKVLLAFLLLCVVLTFWSKSAKCQDLPISPRAVIVAGKTTSRAIGLDSARERKPKNLRSRFHVFASCGLTAGGPATNIENSMGQSGYNVSTSVDLFWFKIISTYPTKNSGGGMANIGADVDVLPHWRLGVNYNELNTVSYQGHSAQNYLTESAWRQSWELLATRIVKPYQKGVHRSEWAFGFGFGLNTITSRITGSAFTGGADPNTYGPFDQKTTKVVPGLVLRMSYDRYLVRNLSLFIRLEPRVMAGLSVPEVSGPCPLLAHTVAFSTVDTSAGIHVHF
jgi:hypothetical protein